MPGVPLCLQAGPACPRREPALRAGVLRQFRLGREPSNSSLRPRIFEPVPDRDSANPHGAGREKRLVSPRSPGDSMMSSGADLSTILNRILDAAADNLRIAKILIQMGLDPDN